MLVYKDEKIALVYISYEQAGKVLGTSGKQSPGYLLEGYYVRYSRRYWYHMSLGYMYRVKKASERDYLELLFESSEE